MGRKISFIGVGNMATAILRGITTRSNDPILWSDVILYNRHSDKIKMYSQLGAIIANDLIDAVEKSDCIFLCVKPQNFQEILPKLSLVPGVEKKLFVSIAAGVTTAEISCAAGGAPVVRVMPNTPMLIGCGVSAICRNEKVSDIDFRFASDIFSSAGKIIEIQEDEMNRIICVSGSSPAYIFMLIKAMYLGAVEQGLLKSEDSSSGLTEKELIDVICEVIIGSAKLMQSGDKTPDEQIKTVCSKGGTTEQAVHELEKCNFYQSLSNAMKKCTQRAEELGKNK